MKLSTALSLLAIFLWAIAAGTWLVVPFDDIKQISVCERYIVTDDVDRTIIEILR